LEIIILPGVKFSKEMKLIPQRSNASIQKMRLEDGMEWNGYE
jgi:hypothetical protein